MDIIKNISYKVSKELAQKCKNENTGNQIAIINQSIFEDSKINHIKRLKYQYELLKFSETKKSTFNSAYILNLIAQTNTQMGNLSTALDNLLSAEKKWNQVLTGNCKRVVPAWHRNRYVNQYCKKFLTY